ncbi:hypothetical protein FN846DRAFT_776598 [Sphaerosporella brunnea]|uniref:Uncharacterized protein n=1 Tax=Sphaerosporella brunnea TaxID=1250544 RepID=A0A5J5F160_9PEZI|nr:hypothetical protein FN846DRAFT_776598 [Sphaerosporella brunnea]
MYEGSVCDGQEGERDSDLSRRAERILANAKRKLDLCGQNISRARSSLILSPSATPTALLENLAAVGPTVRARAESAGGSRSQHWRYNNQQAKAEERGPVHLRTSSESAVHPARGLGLERSYGGDIHRLAGVPEEVEKPQQRGVIRSNSTQQMRALRDQMKDLRGKITSLQEQNRDSMKRRQSVSSMRSSDSTSTWSPATPSLEEIRESRVLNLDVAIEKQWENHIASQHIASQQRASSRYSSTDSDRSGTPTGPRREDINSPTFGQYRTSDAFSYDNNMYRATFLKCTPPGSMSSIDTASTATATLPLQPPQLPTLERKGSFVSISSYATANENNSAPESPVADEPLHSKSLRPPPAWTTANGSPGDDGYHSGPNTPRVEKNVPQNTKQQLSIPASSWYRDSMDTFRTRSVVFEDGDRENGGVSLGISASSRDSQTMVVAGMGGAEEMELKMGRSDRVLIEGVIEALGRVCFAMETDGERSRGELRDRLREAMRVLEGDDGEMF